MAEGKGNKGRVILLILLLLFLGLSGVLYYNNMQVKKEHQKTQEELQKTMELKAQLESELTALKQELENYKGKNEELNALVEAKQRELDSLLNVVKKWRGSYFALRKKYNELKAEREKLLAKIDSLVKANQALTQENVQLKQNLEQEQQRRQQLEEKIQNSQMLRAGNIKGWGFREKAGQKVKTYNYKKAKEIQVCFDVLKHPIVQPGTKTAYVRIISPAQQIFYDENLGSGKFKDLDMNAELQYTTKVTFDYTGEDKNLCVVWPETDKQEFLPGKYQVEVYIDGHVGGYGDFELKKGLFVK